RLLHEDWRFWARPEQLAPEGDWRIWLFLGGRGAGKTRAGAEWITRPNPQGPMQRIALVGAPHAPVRDVMIHGGSGLKSVWHERGFAYEPSKRLIRWPDAVAHVFTAEEADGLRGHTFDGAWCDEVAKWRNAQPVLDMLEMSLRAGDAPRMVLTTTP